MQKEYIGILVMGLYALLIMTMMVFAMYSIKEKAQKVKNLEDDLLQKLNGKFQIDAKDIYNFGKGLGLPQKLAVKAIYNLYRRVDQKDIFETLKTIVEEIEKEEPFEGLPEELKPSLMRISQIAETSGDPVDAKVLTPITYALNRYVELQTEFEKIRKRNTIAYAISIISFIVTAVGFYYTARTPTLSEIKKVVEPLSKEKQATPDTK